MIQHVIPQKKTQSGIVIFLYLRYHTLSSYLRLIYLYIQSLIVISIMESLEDQLLRTFENLKKITLELQNKYKHQVQNLEKTLNNICSTMPNKKNIKLKHQNQPISKQEPKIDTSKINQQVEKIIHSAKQQLRIINNPTNIKPISKPQQIVPEKKPAIPKGNRSDNKNIVPQFQPPLIRNKNQVTGKITQMTPKTNQIPVRIVNANKNNQLKRPESIDKKNIIDKEKDIKYGSLQRKTIQPHNKVDRQNICQSHSKIQSHNKILHSDLPERLINLRPNVISSQNIPKNNNDVENLYKHIQEYRKQCLGYNQKQLQKISTFIRHFNNLGAIRNTIITKDSSLEELNPTNFIEKRGWVGCGQINFNKFDEVLQDFDQLLQDYKLKISSDLTISPKYRIKIQTYHRLLDKYLSVILTNKQNIKVPQKLQLTYKHNFCSQKQSLLTYNHQVLTQKINKLTLDSVNMMTQITHQLVNSEDLNKQGLKKLMMLIEVSLNQCKKTPILITAQQYEKWKQTYL